MKKTGRRIFTLILACSVMLLPLFNQSAMAATKAVKYKKTIGWFDGPFSVVNKTSSGEFTSSANITDAHAIRFGTLCHFETNKYLESSEISVLTELINGKTNFAIKEKLVKSTIAYRNKDIEEFQLWASGYVNCPKNTPCYYEIFCYNFPYDLSMEGYCCLTNYDPKNVTNSMMK